MPQPEIPRWTQTSLLHRRGLAYDPWEHADAMGIQVMERPLRTANELWLPEHSTIVIKSGMRAVHKRTALAHGIGHAALAHEDDRPKFENQADRYATLYLIHPDELDAVRQWTLDLPTIAVELGVTARLLAAYLAA